MKFLQGIPSVSLSDRAYLPALPGVYIAATPDQLLYVGQSVNMCTRWIQHHHFDRLMGFPDVRLYYLQVPQGFCPQLESALIRQFTPLLNVRKGEVPIGIRPLNTDKRIGVSEIPLYHYKRFLLWSFCDRKSAPNLAKDVLVERVEANQEIIDLKLAEVARLYGLSVDHLTGKIITGEISAWSTSLPLLAGEDEDEDAAAPPSSWPYPSP